jgi:hypothetical protein
MSRAGIFMDGVSASIVMWRRLCRQHHLTTIVETTIPWPRHEA